MLLKLCCFFEESSKFKEKHLYEKTILKINVSAQNNKIFSKLITGGYFCDKTDLFLLYIKLVFPPKCA